MIPLTSLRVIMVLFFHSTSRQKNSGDIAPSTHKYIADKQIWSVVPNFPLNSQISVKTPYVLYLISLFYMLVVGAFNVLLQTIKSLNQAIP